MKTPKSGYNETFPYTPKTSRFDDPILFDDSETQEYFAIKAHPANLSRGYLAMFRDVERHQAQGVA